MTSFSLARAIASGASGRAVPAVRPWAIRLAVAGLCLCSALLLTAVRLQAIRLGYELNDLVRERQALAARVGELEMELSSLASPDRIEREARRLGFVYPAGAAIVLLDE